MHAVTENGQARSVFCCSSNLWISYIKARSAELSCTRETQKHKQVIQSLLVHRLFMWDIVLYRQGIRVQATCRFETAILVLVILTPMVLTCTKRNLNCGFLGVQCPSLRCKDQMFQHHPSPVFKMNASVEERTISRRESDLQYDCTVSDSTLIYSLSTVHTLFLTDAESDVGEQKNMLQH